jgi:hypothetical protein
VSIELHACAGRTHARSHAWPRPMGPHANHTRRTSSAITTTPAAGAAAKQRMPSPGPNSSRCAARRGGRRAQRPAGDGGRRRAPGLPPGRGPACLRGGRRLRPPPPQPSPRPAPAAARACRAGRACCRSATPPRAPTRTPRGPAPRHTPTCARRRGACRSGAARGGAAQARGRQETSRSLSGRPGIPFPSRAAHAARSAAIFARGRGSTSVRGAVHGR